jgi:hypothetical protein
MSALKKFCLTAALTALTLPAWAALTYTASGNYNVGTSSSAGSTATLSGPCGNISGQNAEEFNGAGNDNIGIHAYSCDDSLSNFGSRASGENTYYAQGISSIIGTQGGSDSANFAFIINPGEVGAFGSTAFAAGEFQKARLSIKLVIDNTVYLDEAWSAEVGAGGAITNSYDSLGLLSVGWTSSGGAGYFSYGITGGAYSIPLLALPGNADHDISYVMTSESSGNITTTNICTAVLAQAPNAPFSAYCGAGARSGDPDNDPIAQAQAQLPEPMTAGLALTALLAAFGVRRRNGKR